MLNLIKMDLHRLFRIKSFWIMILTTLILTIFGTYMTYFGSTNYEPIVSSNNMALEAPDVQIGFGVRIKPEWANKVDFNELFNSNIQGNMLAILCAIFTVIFVNGDQKNGYIKNIAGQFSNKGMLVLSKLVAVAVQLLVIFIVYSVTSALIGKICWGDKLVFDAVSDFVKLFSIQYFLHFSFASLISAFTIILKSGSLAMTFGIFSAAGITSLLHSLIDILLHKCNVSKEFSISNYFIENCIKTFSIDLNSDDFTRIVIVGIAVFIASTFASMLIMQKRDIR